MHRPTPTRATNYYSILKVAPSASAEEIRASFKRLMLESHPDKNPGRREWSERRVRELIEAFDVLGKKDSRAEFDRSRAPGPAPVTEKVEPFFLRKEDPESKALRVLYFLLHGDGALAAKVLREMELRMGREFLRDYLDRDDYLDCLFLLAEFHAGQRRYRQAAECLQAFYLHEKLARFPRHYLPEVIRQLKDLYLRKIPRQGSREEALQALKDASALHLTRSEEGLRLRKMAKMLLDAGDTEEARKVLDRADRLFPLSKDFQKFRKILEAAG